MYAYRVGYTLGADAVVYGLLHENPPEHFSFFLFSFVKFL